MPAVKVKKTNKKIIGIMDPKGINSNPITNEPYSENYKTLGNIWSNFPIYKDTKNIFKILKNRVTLVQSGTGSGKTVLFPKYALHKNSYKKRVVVTGPKRTVTKENAKFAAATLDVTLGKEVGYKFRGSKAFNKDTLLLFCTDGTILSWFMNNDKEQLGKIDTLILDEVHERSVRMELLLGLLPNIMKKYDFNLILMSATVDPEPLKKYFKKINGGEIGYYNNPGAKNYGKKIIFSENTIDQRNIINEAVEKTSYAFTQIKDGDALVFLPSKNDTKSACELINKKKDKDGCPINKETVVFCSSLFSGLSKDEQELAINKDIFKQKCPRTERKVVMSTNVAESSLTVDNLSIVIDSGLGWKTGYDPIKEIETLEKKRVSKAEIKQRWGRVGRISFGTVFCLYTEKEFEILNEYPEPDILIENLVEMTHQLTKWLGGTKKKLELFYNKLITPPKKELVNHSWNELVRLKLADDTKLNKFGKLTATIGIEPVWSAILMDSYFAGCIDDALTICAITQISKGWNDWRFIRGETSIFEKEYKDDRGDPWLFYNLWNEWRNPKKTYEEKVKWAISKGINPLILHKIGKERRRIRYRILEHERIEVKGVKLNDILRNSFRKLVHIENDIYKCIKTGTIGKWEHSPIPRPREAFCLSGISVQNNISWWYVICD